ncbi:hypothetical protein BJ508DRAFT_415562 [Ascobolus immersus RN42]|uniref:BTB domain-containing protein n=1 Tax=Ascobolus immersus RN42 TaxID=1160509 RepID=A0A3N4I7G9_ASCIM|nr:hypothetical protein BJ508DRAFT_415562 [Ascobolus immersus RN42]
MSDSNNPLQGLPTPVPTSEASQNITIEGTTQPAKRRRLEDVTAESTMDPENNNNGSISDIDDDDSASICSDITAESDSPPPSRGASPDSSGRPYEVKPSQATDPSTAVQKLFLQEIYSDFKIIVGDKTYPAHKNIVCSQSEYFTCAFRNNFVENQDSIITITDETPKSIYRLLHYLYGKNYDDFPNPEGPFSDGSFEYTTRVNFTMYRLADKYGIPGLAKLAVAKQQEYYLDTDIDVSQIVWAARRAYARFQGRHDAMRMLHVIETGRRLAKCTPKQLFLNDDNEDVYDLDDFRAFCKENGEFGWDVWQHYNWEKAHGEDDRPEFGEGRPKEWKRSARGGWDLVLGWDYAEWIQKSIQQKKERLRLMREKAERDRIRGIERAARRAALLEVEEE